MRISKTFKQNRTATGIEYQPQLTGEITCTLNNQYNSNEVYKYGNSNSVSFTANLLLTQNDVYLIKKYTGKQLPEGEFSTVRVCMFGKDAEHLAKQPLCKHGQKIAFYATDWEITQGTKANGGTRYYFNAIAQYYRFIDQEATEQQATTTPAAPSAPLVTEEIRYNGLTEAQIDYAIKTRKITDKVVDAVLAKAEAAANDDLPF